MYAVLCDSHYQWCIRLHVCKCVGGEGGGEREREGRVEGIEGIEVGRGVGEG